ncbi:MAG: class I SAM-dependent methyltransferase [Candidatus Aenigmarchaeota archaeon]|nr:class I SAM-dependent methyltransferase [Candidatus Aenigmarchaeota archaeon]
MDDHLEQVRRHFDSKYTDYDACSGRVVPSNEELQRALVEAIHHRRDASLAILDLGVGTGLTSWLVVNAFPNARIDGIDFSAEMLRHARERLAKFDGRVRLVQADITQHAFDRQYDVVISAVTIHNLPHPEKRLLFANIHRHLKDDGCFVNADFITFGSQHLASKTAASYEKFLAENLAGQELEHWLKHAREQDLPASMDDQTAWLRQAGFRTIECSWLQRNLAVYCATK